MYIVHVKENKSFFLGHHKKISYFFN